MNDDAHDNPAAGLFPALAAALGSALPDDPGDGDPAALPDDAALAATLLSQAAALDDAFRHLLAEAPRRYEKMAHYSAALRAQNQFRHTLLALRLLKNNKTGGVDEP